MPPEQHNTFKAVVLYSTVIVVFILSGHHLMREPSPDPCNGNFSNNIMQTSDISSVVDCNKQPVMVVKSSQHQISRKQLQANNLSNLIQRRLVYLQNPPNCSKTRKLVCTFRENMCGFGCSMHKAAFCMIIAYATQRTLLMDPRGWKYAGGWEGAFLPVSKCRIDTMDIAGLNRFDATLQNSDETLLLGNQQANIPQKPLAVPRDLVKRIQAFHSFPFGWFIGQIFKYMWKPNIPMMRYMLMARKELNLYWPIVGVHVRSTDGLKKGQLPRPIEIYMDKVEQWFERDEEARGVSLNGSIRSVYIATDNPEHFRDAKKKYPHYNIIGNLNASQSAYDYNRHTGARYTTEGLYGIIFDIQMLSECDYIVCSFGSNACRTAFELMQANYMDTSKRYYSLGRGYTYSNAIRRIFIAQESHTAASKEELSFKAGALVEIFTNRADGWSVGLLRRDKTQSGLIPSHKIKERVKVEDFPTYPQV